jgi:hypothetical protein
VKSSTNLREAFLVFLSLTVIALFNAGLLWEKHKISLQYMNFELTRMLDLNENQVEEIRSIQIAYEIELSKVSRHGSVQSREKIQQLVCERNRQIMDLLNERQMGILNSYCTDLMSFAKMLE